MLAGVAGGLAEMWGADPSLVRVIWALLIIFTGGIAFLVYIVMALVVPEEPEIAADAQALVAPPPGAGADWTPPTDPNATRQAAREARAAARRASGGSRGAFPASVILGGFLIVLGGFFLAREFLPQIDFDWFWPLILVGIGILLVVTAMRRPSEPG